jgi:hypothetical protein
MDDEEIEVMAQEPAAPVPDYAFDGYSVEFLDKVALLPPGKGA